MACLRALQKIDEIKGTFAVGAAKVVIKADSAYLVKGMTEWIFNWRENGYTNAQDFPVFNADLFRSIDQQIIELNNAGVEVLFWHVLRSRNKEADRLANDAFGVWK